MNKKEMIEGYKKMAKSSPRDMKGCIRKYLEKTAAEDSQFAAKLDMKHFNDCINFVIECAREILSSKSGEVADDICYRMARDYFNEQMWTFNVKSSVKDVEKECVEEVKVEKKPEAPKRGEQLSLLELMGV